MNAKDWFAWEKTLRELLASPKLLEFIEENQHLNGYQSPSGRLTYSRMANKHSFGAFSNVVVDVISRERVYAGAKSIAHALLRKNMYKDYVCIFSSLEDDDFEYERESMNDTMNELLESVGASPLAGIAILDNDSLELFHGIAFIVWKHASGFKFAFYDPLAFQKRRKRADGTTYMTGYDYAAKTFQSANFDENIEFIDLSQYCFHTSPQEFHCPQYVMDAEYCYLNSLYFLYQWVHAKTPLDANGLRHVVEACYIQEPALLKRPQSMVYRVVMYSFILTVVATYTKTREHLNKIKQIQEEWITEYTFPIVFSRDLALQKI